MFKHQRLERLNTCRRQTIPEQRKVLTFIQKHKYLYKYRHKPLFAVPNKLLIVGTLVNFRILSLVGKYYSLGTIISIGAL